MNAYCELHSDIYLLDVSTRIMAEISPVGSAACHTVSLSFRVA